MGRKIVFINQATGYLTIDIVNEFAKSGEFEKVALVAGSIRLQDVPIAKTVKWSKIALYDRGSPRNKLLSWIKGTLQVFWLLLIRFRKYEIFYITIPPFAYLISLILPNRFSILIFDVYPDVLKIFNISENNLIYKLWTKLNNRLFNKAHRLYTIGDGMANLLEKYVSRHKIIIIPNWSGLTEVLEITKDKNKFIESQKITQKFIVQYSGNIGYTHNVEVLVELAQDMQSYTDIYFLIIGRGDKYNTIQHLLSKYQLKNCKLLPFQPDNTLNYTLSAADLGVVLLDEKTAHVSIPSKIYNLQKVGVPILGIADVKSELSRHLSRHKNGKCFSPNEWKSIKDYILFVKNNPSFHNELKINSREAAKYYTMENASKYFNTYL